MDWFISDPREWADAQFRDVDLGDTGRTERLVKLAGQMANNPSGSFPDACECWADVKAAYRLFDEEDVTFGAVATAHWERTRRVAPGRYLIINDTTEVDWGRKRQIEGLKPIGNGTGRGFLLHSALMVAAETEEVVGLAGQGIYYRQEVPKGESRTERLARRRESDVWRDVIDRVGRLPEGVKAIHVLDRGGDDFEVFCHMLDQASDGVVRAKNLNRKMLDPSGRETTVKAYLATLPVSGSFELPLRARPDQPARTAKLVVSFGALSLMPPKLKSPELKRRQPQPIPMRVVWVREVDARPGVAPIDWVLYTSLAVQSFEDALQVVRYYDKRWLIEEFHKALKTGCQVQKRQLKISDRLEPMVALLSVVAVRLVQLKGVARAEPDRPVAEVVPKRYVALLERAKGKGRRRWIKTVGQFFRTLAKLGGFLGRKGDGEPGWITIWRGWDKLELMLRGAELVHDTA